MHLLRSLLLALAVTPWTLAGSPLQGTVTDPGGFGLRGAMVLIHRDLPEGVTDFSSNMGIRRDIVLTTDRDGQFAVDLPPGFYDVFVTAHAFSPTCQKIRTTKMPTPALTFQLKIEPLYTDEVGFTIKAEPAQKP